MTELSDYVDGLPNVSGREQVVEEAIAAGRSEPVFTGEGRVRLEDIDSAFAIALHMHQPLIPAGGPDQRTAPIISNLKAMMDHQDIGDNHNAPVFLWCYKRMGEFIPQLVDEGHSPRVMLDYSGTLLHGLYDMGAHDALEALGRITSDHRYRQAVEWLGTAWGHPVAPSTPVQDYRLHVRAWQHHFAALFGLEALGRVRGFSPAEMALPNHPDVAYEFVRTLRDCGYQWVLVQEHTVETPDGQGLDRPHLPHLLRGVSSGGEVAEIVAIVKTQGSDTKLVAQMQPYYEARGLRPCELAGRSVPPLVTQIADGENGGVMMNEFPPKYFEVVRECSHTRTPMVNVSEYLEQLWAAGIRPSDLPVVQPVLQHRIWQLTAPGEGPDRLAAVVQELQEEDGSFHMEGGSWTSNLSWVRGYEHLLIPMDKASALFHERVLSSDVETNDRRYRNALFHLLAAETSCFRYWGEGMWTDYGAELARRADSIVASDL
ncbi:MAG: glycosyl hydrolase family 57 [Actinomycetota bacterium]|nr:glycosyl hydrolase family 57 [Actinomycetota bacterium]